MLTWVMSHAELTFWPEVALVMFLGVFLASLYRVLWQSDARDYQHDAMLPFEEEN
jgi:cbb3-type cytochrome oxidase subunit 3